MGQGGGQEVRVEQHVAVHQADERLEAVLKAELWTDPAARTDLRVELNHPDRVFRRDLERAIARATIGHDDFAADHFNRGEHALDRGTDPNLFVKGLEDY